MAMEARFTEIDVLSELSLEFSGTCINLLDVFGIIVSFREFDRRDEPLEYLSRFIN